MTDSDEPQLEVSAEHTAVAMADGSAQVVDVREAYERDAGHIVGSRHIALGTSPPRRSHSIATVP